MGRDEIVERRRLSFGAAAVLYDSVRPSYPDEAARWMLGDTPRRVADVGAGTGIFTRVLEKLGHDVVAVEPDPGMRARLAERSPGVAVLAGSAEQIPLPDGTLDAVTAAQAMHWFDPGRAYDEIARVIRTGGVFAPIWNVRDESIAWVAELSGLVGLEDGSRNNAENETQTDFGPHFGTAEYAEFSHVVVHTAETLVALVQSRSQFLIADDDEKQMTTDAVRDLAARLPERFELPYVTRGLKAERLPD